MSVSIVAAEKPYIPENGDLLCDFGDAAHSRPSQYLETPLKAYPKGQVMPLGIIHPNPLQAATRLGIDTLPILSAYSCPYTGYEFWTIVPVAICSTNLKKKWGEAVRAVYHSPELALDHDWHRRMHKDEIFELSDIGRLLLGSGYTSSTGINDGSRSRRQTAVRLSNGDMLWVHFWEWYNK